uniref:PH domain-containing protein n=1 Tax=Hanusia phi TaxID=3032 RepID=A0A7S0DXV8_9CRYP
MSVQHMTVADVEALMSGAAGSSVRLQICKGRQMQVLADRLDALEVQQLDEDILSKEEEEVDKPAVKEVTVERLHGRTADGFEQAVLEEAGDGDSQAQAERQEPTMSINASETTSSHKHRKEELDKKSFMICNTRSGPAKLQRAILIQDVSKVALLEPEEYGRDNCFKVQIHSMKGVFAFQAADSALAAAWVEQIMRMKEEYDELQKKSYFRQAPGGAQPSAS